MKEKGDYMRDQNTESIRAKLDSLREVPPRSKDAAMVGKRRYLTYARNLSSGVSLSFQDRLNHWIAPAVNLFRRKEQAPMFQLMMTVLVIFGIVFGGGGVTVAAAQASLPDEVLYPVKLWSEDVQSAFTPTEKQWEVELKFADRRIAEITQMIMGSETPPESLQDQYQARIENAVRFSELLPGEQAVKAREEIRLRLLIHAEVMTQLRAKAPESPYLVQAQEMIQTRLSWVEGLPPGGTPQKGPGQNGSSEVTPGQGNGSGNDSPGTGNGSNAGPGNGGNPYTEGTPTPGSSYGPGDGTGITCTPNSGVNNPWTTDIPTPGSSYGPGTGDCTTTTCTPQAGPGGNQQVTPAPNSNKP